MKKAFLAACVFLAVAGAAEAKEGYLAVSEKHEIFYETFGNEEGIPVVVLHGGPGLGCNPNDVRFFDLRRYHVVMFDQRGASRSKPFACMEENTTKELIGDIETLRKHLQIERWVVFGGSWGSFLSLAYGEAHPKSCLGFILWGVFLGRAQDIRLFSVNEEASSDLHREFLQLFAIEERSDLLASSYKKIMDPDPEVHMNFAKAYLRYHMLRTMNSPTPQTIQKSLENEKLVLSMMRALLHYASHRLFIEPNQILDRVHRITHLPAVIVQGMKDINCLPEQARLLNDNWERSNLWLIEEGGHSSNDPAIAPALLKATNAIADQLEG